MKKITICNKEYNIACNAFTYISFRKKFNRGIFDDINILNGFLNKQVILANEIKKNNPKIKDSEIIASLSSCMLPDMDNFVEASTRIAYIMIYTANSDIEEYEDWLKSINKITTNDAWIVEVTEFAVSCFC